MAVIEIDVVYPQPFQTLLARLADILWLISYAACSVGPNVDCEFGGEEDVVPLAGSLKPSVAKGKGLSAESSGRIQRRAGVSFTYFPSKSSLSP